MKRMKFDWLMLILTFGFSAIGVAVCLLTKDLWVDDDTKKILWSGMFFALPLVCSLIGMCITEYIRGKECVIHKKGSRIVSFIVAIVIGFGIGALGQWLFNIMEPKQDTEEAVTQNEKKPTEKAEEPTEIETEIKVTQIVKPIDICVLLDVSGTMWDVVDAYKVAMCELLDDLAEEHSVQVITFDRVCCELMELTGENKEYLKNLITGINYFNEIGSSEPTMALENAYDTLTGEESTNSTKVVIVVSDSATDSIEYNQELQDRYIDNGITVYSILNEYWSGSNGPFWAFVEETGGFNTNIEYGEIDTQKLLETLQVIYEESTEIIEIPVEEPPTEVETEPQTEKETEKEVVASYDSPMFPCDKEDIGVAKALVRFVLLMLYAVLATWVMYYTISVSGIIYALVMGIGATLLLLLAGEGIVFVTLIYAVLFLTAFTGYYATYRGELI